MGKKLVLIRDENDNSIRQRLAQRIANIPLLKDTVIEDIAVKVENERPIFTEEQKRHLAILGVVQGTAFGVVTVVARKIKFPVAEAFVLHMLGTLLVAGSLILIDDVDDTHS